MTATKTNPRLRIRWAFWILGAALGFSQAWISRFDASDNLVSYLEMGGYFFHGHPGAIVNGFWSPLNAWLFGLAIALFRPSPYWEYPTAHLLVFIIFLFTMACFDYFLMHLIELRSDWAAESSSGSDCASIAIGYTIFLWSSLQLITINDENPNLLVAALFYISCGLLLSIWTGRARTGAFLGLGVTQGLTYLANFLLLPTTVAILVIAALAAKQKARYVAVSAIAFLAIAVPFIAALSAQKGRLTTGESFVYDYAINVNGIPRHHWQGNDGMPLKHPTRQIFQAPPTFEFREPLKGTYPPEYDISYWYEGLKPRVHLGQQIEVLAHNLFSMFETLFFSMNGVLLSTLFLALYSTGRGWLVLKDLLRRWFLIVPCVVTAGLYALFLYLAQYLAAFFVVLLVCLFLSARCAATTRLLSGVAVLQFVMFFGLVGLPTLVHALHIHQLQSPTVEAASYQEIAAKALEMGLKPGDEIASLNAGNAGMAMWAHLAHVQIIAEVYWTGHPAEAKNNFWNADTLTQDQVLQRLSQTGARAIVSGDAPSGAAASRWSEIGTTGYYLYWPKPIINR